MKTLNFFVSEYDGARKEINKQMVPQFRNAAVLTVLIVAGIFALLLVTKGNRSLWAHMGAQNIDIVNVIAVVISPLLIVSYRYFIELHNLHTFFWKKFAQKNGGVYKSYRSVKKEKTRMFRQGTYQRIDNVVSFTEGQDIIRFFQFMFSKKNIMLQKNTISYYYTVMLFTVQGNIPHLYLNYKANKYGVNIGQSLSLPAEFEKYFDVSVPQGYHIEALEIFTPEILAAILDFGIHLDIELCNNKIYFYIEKGGSGDISSVEHIKDLEIKYKAVATLLHMLKPRLDRFHFEKIGNLSHKL